MLRCCRFPWRLQVRRPIPRSPLPAAVAISTDQVPSRPRRPTPLSKLAKMEDFRARLDAGRDRLIALARGGVAAQEFLASRTRADAGEEGASVSSPQPDYHIPGTKGASMEESFNIFRAGERSGYEFARPLQAHLEQARVLARQQRDKEEKVSLVQVLDGLWRPESTSDAVHAWQVLASVSTASQDFSWEDGRLEKLVSVICGFVTKMDWAQLQSMVWATSLVHRYGTQKPPSAIRTVWNALDHECTGWLRKEIREANNGLGHIVSDRRVELLRMAYLSIKVGQVTNYSPFKWTSRYVRQVVTAFLGEEKHLAQVTAQECVFLMFLLGLQREFPTPYEVKAVGITEDESELVDEADVYGEIDIPPYLADKLTSVLPELEVGEIGVVCHSIHKTRMKLHTQSRKLNNSLQKVLLNAPDEDLLRNEFAISCICKILKNRGTVNFELIKCLMDKYLPLLRHLHPMTRIRVMNMFVHPIPKGHKPLLKEFARCCLGQLDNLRIKDLEQIAFILYIGNYTRDPSVYQAIGSAIDGCTLSDPRSGRSLVYLASFLAKKGFFKDDLITEIMSSANACEPLHAATTESELVKASLDLLLQLGRPRQPQGRRDFHLAEVRSYEMRRSKMLYRIALFYVAELDCNVELDHPQYGGSRLDPDLRKKFLPLGQFDAPLSASERLKADVLGDLWRIYGKKGARLAKLLPHAVATDIVLCLTKLKSGKWVAFPLEEDKLEALSAEIQSSRVLTSLDGGSSSSSSVAVAVLVPKRSHFDGDGDPVGPLAFKARQLTSLGYRVVMVRHYVYAASKREGVSTKYLHGLITAKVNR